MTCSTATQLEPFAPPHRTLFSTRSLGVFGVFAAIIFFASSAAPTPLFSIYQERFGLSPAMLTLIFAAYAFSLLAALLTVGSLSDYIGRRPVIFAALVANAVSMVIFLSSHSAGMLITARIVQGFATGAAATALGATILDTNRKFAALINSITTFLGLTIGVLVSGALVSYAPYPTQLIYVVLLMVSAAAALLVLNMPETAVPKHGALASLKPQVLLPAKAMPTLALVSPVNIAAWAVGGLNLSLMPSLVRVATGLSSPFISALVVATLVFSAAVAVVAMRQFGPDRVLRFGSLSLVLGMFGILAGVYTQTALFMLTGAVAAGVGFGAALSGAMRSLLPLAEPGERAGLLAALYIESYLAFSLPVILAGLAAPRLGLATTTYVFGAAIMLLAIGKPPIRNPLVM